MLIKNKNKLTKNKNYFLTSYFCLKQAPNLHCTTADYSVFFHNAAGTELKQIIVLTKRVKLIWRVN